VKNNIALKVAGIIFLLMSIMHLLRLLLKIEVTMAGFTVPLWFSVFGFLIALLLSLWMFKSLK
jgi:hypothetical protein